MNREELRRKVLAARDGLPADLRQDAATRVFRLLSGWPVWQRAQTVMVYLNFRSEVATGAILQAAIEAGKKVAAPVTVRKGHELIARLLQDPEKDLVRGAFGIAEPGPQCQELEPENLDLVLVPGSVFDRRGGRLGYGGGYYDRFFASRAPQALRVALCYEMQLAGQVPVQAHDVPMHYIITEKQIIETGAQP